MHDITRVWLQRLPHPIAANILCYQETCASTNIELFFSPKNLSFFRSVAML